MLLWRYPESLACGVSHRVRQIAELARHQALYYGLRLWATFLFVKGFHHMGSLLKRLTILIRYQVHPHEALLNIVLEIYFHLLRSWSN
jgi:hypothetical protein